jgi:hypothetical protein
MILHYQRGPTGSPHEMNWKNDCLVLTKDNSTTVVLKLQSLNTCLPLSSKSLSAVDYTWNIEHNPERHLNMSSSRWKSFYKQQSSRQRSHRTCVFCSKMSLSAYHVSQYDGIMYLWKASLSNTNLALQNLYHHVSQYDGIMY